MIEEPFNVKGTKGKEEESPKKKNKVGPGESTQLHRFFDVTVGNTRDNQESRWKRQVRAVKMGLDSN